MGHNIGANNISGHQPTDNCPSVSLIIPVFNAAEYIEECLRSIRSQSFHDFEVIIVDDESTDNSVDIITKFCNLDARFNLVKNTHGGLSKSRNTGIDIARGKYIGFVDADDCLYPNAINLMLSTLKNTNANICIARMAKGKHYDASKKAKLKQSIIMEYSTAINHALYQRYTLSSACGMLMERQLIGNNKRFRERIMYEDLDAFYLFYENAKRIAYLPTKVYFYRQAESSFMHKWSHQRLDVLDVTDRIVEYMKEHHPELMPAALDRRFSAHFNILLLMLRLGINDHNTTERCFKIILESRRQELRDSQSRLKNKLGALASFGGIKFLKILSKFFY